MGTETGRKIEPGAVDAEEAQRALRRINDYLSHTARSEADVRVHLETGATDDALVLPRPVVDMFASMLAALANGQGVQIMPMDAVLTTQQAADMLSVSRPYLIGLLEDGRIPYTLVGRHRRIRFADLRQYLREDDVKRKDAAVELAELDQELGLL
ncbi:MULTISPECIES: helix-turn-helix domain-containing protein [Streptomyces]|uniref:Helix-turn-helix domain-containing protein n=1 Tax=Streptomyces globisporus TaxID=1908 RepID=A0A927BKW7_STRGL|nr:MULTISPECIES: helix-turn-helix domain-containing protein [Streptomyces]MBD2828687.1 helix-turn-helix domain-containing protein [Streptomyces globisporus]MYW82643.1 excisionase family DNA-binding protein [Streptomyces sp. SID8369]NEC46299.1 helix-turn-helix domain-containing protein [Streptomyces sp. SID8016]KOG82106.1 excisionase [Streptomyces griseus subsp. rhodochrous]MBD3547513.1 helix-turn-helix domain-containing protein [Streptomyces sp. JV180]